ncbi:MAG: hypothetical protein AAGC66_09385 [Leifsonia sp.]
MIERREHCGTQGLSIDESLQRKQVPEAEEKGSDRDSRSDEWEERIALKLIHVQVVQTASALHNGDHTLAVAGRAGRRKAAGVAIAEVTDA